MVDVDKISITKNGVLEQGFTPEEIAQREYEASLPVPVQPPTPEERLQALEEAMLMLI